MKMMCSVNVIAFCLIYLARVDTERTNLSNIWNSECEVNEKAGLYYVNCSSRDLYSIPTLPEFSTGVDLSKNNITVISGTPFSNMSKLREVDLSNNPLKLISPTIFRGLTKLTNLYIRNTKLDKQQHLVLDTLLSDMTSLRSFSFTFELPEYKRFTPVDCFFLYRNQPFGKVDSLMSVETLEIDSALLKWKTNEEPNIFVSRTKSLYLINGRVCFYTYLTKDQFDYMPLLENVTIENPFTTRQISDDFIKSQFHLKNLAIFGPKGFGVVWPKFIFNVTKSVSSLRNLDSLTLMDLSYDQRIRLVCFVGFYDLVLAQNLHTLNLAGNSLSLDYIAECFPSTLKHLFLSRNCLSSYDLNNILSAQPLLQTLDANYQNSCSFRPRTSDLLFVTKSSRNHETEYVYRLEKLIFTHSQSTLEFGFNKYVYKYLKYLDLSQNGKGVSVIVPESFSIRRPNLEYLNMSNCRITLLKKHSLSNLTKLQYLDLSSNRLGEMKCKLLDSLYNLRSLIHLNLANNKINCLTSYMFEAMEHIEKVDLSNNNIQSFDAALDCVINLKYLDLSENNLQKINSARMNELDTVAKSHPIYVDLSGNMLLCTCGTLDFLRWVETTTVRLKGKDGYMCSYSNGSTTHLKELSNIIEGLTAECSSKTAVIISVSASVACCLAVMCGITIYRYRWRLRYWYYKSKIKIPYQIRGHNYEQIFEYDMFISYSSEDYEIVRQGTMDELETKRGLRCCIHERDFQPGESIAYNISKGIRESKRTVLFLSKRFLASEWCMYELNIARMEALHTGRKVILVVKVENIPNKNLPVDVLDVIDVYTYLEYPNRGTQNDFDVFWSRCADFVLDT